MSFFSALGSALGRRKTGMSSLFRGWFQQYVSQSHGSRSPARTKPQLWLEELEPRTLLATGVLSLPSTGHTVTVASSPTATFSGLSSVQEGSTNTTVTFSNATGGSGGYTYSYDFNNSGTFQIIGSSSPTATTPESYVDDGPSNLVVHGRITDSGGKYTDYTTSITVTNVAPTAILTPSGSVAVGSPITVSISNPIDPSNADTAAGFHYSFALSQSALATTYAAGTTASSANFTFQQTGIYTVYGSIIDKNDASTIYTSKVTVLSAPVILDNSGSGFSKTGTGWTGSSAGYLGGLVTNSSAPGAVSATWQTSGLFPGSYLVQATWNGGAAHTGAATYNIYDGNTLIQTVTVSQKTNPIGPVFGGVAFQTLATVPLSTGTLRVVLVSQGSGGLGADAIRIAPPGISPTATFSGPTSVTEGTTNAKVTFGQATLGSGGYTYSYDFGNTGTFEIAGSSNPTATVPESYVDNGPSTLVVRGRITDSSGNYSDYTTSISVTNVAPTASIIMPSTRVVGTALAFSASVTDPSTADTKAGFTYSWNFGDGSAAVSGALPSHTYSNPGVYTVTLKVTDKDGGVGTASSTITIVSVGYITTPYLNIPDFGAKPTIVSVQSGNWSNPATWSLNRVPQAGDIVDITAGTTVTYDVNDTTNSAPLNTVEVKNGATLTFSTTKTTQMYVVNLMVLQGGELDIGTQANPIPTNVTATVVWINQPINTTLDPEQYGNGLIVLGTMNTYGAVKAAYVTLGLNAHAGDTVLQLASPAAGWQVGDKLQLPDTRQLTASQELGNYTSEAEIMTIQSISANGMTITLAAPLQFDHLGGSNAQGALTYLPQVVDMTRNVSIHSQSATGTRGYALFTGNANVNINYTSFGGMGRTTANAIDDTTFDTSGNVTHIGANEENRNAITFLDLIGPKSPQANGYQFTFNGNVVTCPLTPMPFIWGINVVNSYYGLIQNNDVVNWNGAGIRVDSQSSYNNFTGNFVMRINGTGQRGDEALEGDGYWFGNSNNYVTDNIAADLATNGQYGYGFEFYAITNQSGPSHPVGYVNIAAYQGADPSQPGQSQKVDMNLIPMLDFADNEVYGAAPIGLSYWYINYDPLHPQLTPLLDGGIIKNFVTWNLWGTGIYGYQASNITINGFVDYGDASKIAADSGTAGMQFQDYYTGGTLIENADIENVATGILAPVNNGGTFTVENSYLADQTGITMSALWSVSSQANTVPPRKVVIDNVLFAAPGGGGSFMAVNMNWYTQTAITNGVCPVTLLDQVFVYNYNGVSGNNFQVFYTQQAANFIVPQTILNTNGSYKIMGSPVAGLTNAQVWAQYGVAVAGAVAPFNATTMNGINGLVAPI
jgi:PKD domain/G8 domain